VIEYQQQRLNYNNFLKIQDSGRDETLVSNQVFKNPTWTPS